MKIYEQAKMKIGLVQYSPEWENPEKNIIKIDSMINSSKEKFDLLIFPEMTLTGFTMQSGKFAEEIDGICTKYFMELARRIRTNIFAGIIERDREDIFNSLFHFDPDGLINARYRKIHPYSHATEDKFYNAGNELVVTQIEHKKIGLTICYDLRFPELYRLYVKQDVFMAVDIANWPVQRIDHWKTLLKARAIENQCFVAGVNRVGKDPFNEYCGCSALFDPMGKEIVLVHDEEKIISAEIDHEMTSKTRLKLPFLQDMRLI